MEEITNKLKSLEALETKVEQLEAKLNDKVEKPKCPYCFEDFNSFTKIAQCISGHLVCWNCNQKNNNRDCGLCGQPVNGRAFGMESYLRSIFR